MKKQFLFIGVALVVGSLTLVGFKAKTLAEQKAEIAAAVQAQLEDFKAAKTIECDERVVAEAQRMMEDYRVTQETAVTPKAGIAANAKPATKKPSKPSAKGPKVDPLPQPTAPAPTTNRDRGDGVKPEDNRRRGDAVPTDVPGGNRGRGDAVKTPGGGGN